MADHAVRLRGGFIHHRHHHGLAVAARRPDHHAVVDLLFAAGRTRQHGVLGIAPADVGRCGALQVEQAVAPADLTSQAGSAGHEGHGTDQSAVLPVVAGDDDVASADVVQTERGRIHAGVTTVLRGAHQAVGRRDHRTAAAVAMRVAGVAVDPGDRAGRLVPLSALDDVVGVGVVGVAQHLHAVAAEEVVGMGADQAVLDRHHAGDASGATPGRCARISLVAIGPVRTADDVAAIAQVGHAAAADLIIGLLADQAVLGRHLADRAARAAPGHSTCIRQLAALPARAVDDVGTIGQRHHAVAADAVAALGADQRVGRTDRAACAAVGQLAGLAVHPGDCALVGVGVVGLAPLVGAHDQIAVSQRLDLAPDPVAQIV